MLNYLYFTEYMKLNDINNDIEKLTYRMCKNFKWTVFYRLTLH